MSEASKPDLRPAAGTDALRRLLQDAAKGGAAKVDALVALAQRTVWVALWPGSESFRTLVNSDRLSALPIFTELAELEEASRRFGWAGPDGAVPNREIGAREAFRYVVQEKLAFAVVDIVAAHSIELERDELEPLTTAAARRDSQGPFSGTGKLSSSLMQRVKPASSSGSVRPPSSANVPVVSLGSATASGTSSTTTASPSSPPPAVQATFGGGASVVLTPLSTAPPDNLLKALAEVLRGFPEVEWACLVSAARGPAGSAPAIGLRIDAAFRTRLAEISAGLKAASAKEGAQLDVLVIDEPALVRQAREKALMFFPWRRGG